MKLIVQIPCFDEAQTLPTTLASIPRAVPGFDQVEVLVIDDGSTDGTADVARRHGAHHVVRLSGHKGLGAAFQTGLEACLRLGADVIVNTDADNQYPQHEIARLIEPILTNQSDIVIGARPLHRIAHFSLLKRLMHRMGNWVVRLASGTPVPDATSGFRAMSRAAAMSFCVTTSYSYTLDIVIQAGRKNLRVLSIPIEINRPTRPSRLMRGSLGFIRRQAIAIIRLHLVYAPLRTFLYLSLPFFLAAALLLGRFGLFWLSGGQGIARYVQSVIVGAAALVIAFLLVMVGVIGDLIAANRLRIEDLLSRVKRMEYDSRPAARAPGGGLASEPPGDPSTPHADASSRQPVACEARAGQAEAAQ
jgi:glycosyltransferase involved in cell wall biosynthesis